MIYTNIVKVWAVYSVKGKIYIFALSALILEIIREYIESNRVEGPELFLSTDISYHA
jgi:hypothetical protein